MHVIKARANFGIPEEWHTKHGKDEHDQEEKEANVDQSWEGHDQGEK